jgi:uncharacterized protein YjdB
MSGILKILPIMSVAFLLCVASIGCAAPSLKSIAASPGKVSLAVNTTQQLTITATYTKGNTKNVTAQNTFKSSNEKIATVSKGGLIKGVAAGSASITASYTEGKVTKTVTVPVTVK